MQLLPQGRPGRAARQRRPSVELLEDRCVPATPVTGAVQTNPGTQVALAVSGPTSPGPDSVRVALSGDTAALGQGANNASLLLGVGSALPPAGPALPGAAPEEFGLFASGGQLPAAGEALTAARLSLSPFLTTVPPAYVSNFGPRVEDGVVVSPAVPDRASIGFVGRIVFPGTDLNLRANLPQGPFEDQARAFPRVIPAFEPERPREAPAEARGAEAEAAEELAGAADVVAWLDLGFTVPDLPEVPAPPDEGQ